MQIKFESKGGFDNVLKWMNKASNIQHLARDLAEYGKDRLISETPEDTGETSTGWEYDITTKSNSVEIDWRNVAHPESEVNVAKLIELGHGTGTGGYVPPRPYIKQAMAPVWKSLDDKVKEVVK